MGLGGRHEEGEVWVFSVPSQRYSKVYGHVLIQRENRFGILSFVFNSGVPELAQCHTRICL